MEITVEHRLQRRAKGLVKRVRFIKVSLSRVFNTDYSLMRTAKLFIKRHIWLNLKAMDALCLKAALITLL